MKCYEIEGDFNAKAKFETSSVEIYDYFKIYLTNMSKLNLDVLTAEIRKYIDENREYIENDKSEKIINDEN